MGDNKKAQGKAAAAGEGGGVRGGIGVEGDVEALSKTTGISSPTTIARLAGAQKGDKVTVQKRGDVLPTYFLSVERDGKELYTVFYRQTGKNEFSSTISFKERVSKKEFANRVISAVKASSSGKVKTLSIEGDVKGVLPSEVVKAGFDAPAPESLRSFGKTLSQVVKSKEGARSLDVAGLPKTVSLNTRSKNARKALESAARSAR